MAWFKKEKKEPEQPRPKPVEQNLKQVSESLSSATSELQDLVEELRLAFDADQASAPPVPAAPVEPEEKK